MGSYDRRDRYAPNDRHNPRDRNGPRGRPDPRDRYGPRGRPDPRDRYGPRGRHDPRDRHDAYSPRYRHDSRDRYDDYGPRDRYDDYGPRYDASDRNEFHARNRHDPRRDREDYYERDHFGPRGRYDDRDPPPPREHFDDEPPVFEQGIIKSKNPGGFGFIEIPGYQKDMFFSQRELSNVAFEELQVGDRINFRVAKDRKDPTKWCARDVRKAIEEGIILKLKHGFGFVENERQEEIFFHRTHLRGKSFENLNLGDRVKYRTVVSKRNQNCSFEAQEIELLE